MKLSIIEMRLKLFPKYLEHRAECIIQSRELVMRGDLQWENGIPGSKVKFVLNHNGRWKFYNDDFGNRLLSFNEWLHYNGYSNIII